MGEGTQFLNGEWTRFRQLTLSRLALGARRDSCQTQPADVQRAHSPTGPATSGRDAGICLQPAGSGLA